MKKGQVVGGTVQSVNFPNKGIVECEGHRIAVKGVLPGQKVSVILQKVSHGKAEGRCVEIIQRAPYEIMPQCPHADACGGCSYQTMPYEEQLLLKEQQVLRLMEPVFARQDALETERAASEQAESEQAASEQAASGQAASGQAESEQAESERAASKQAVTALDGETSENRTRGRFEGIRRSPQQFAYRNKMEFTFGDEYKDGPLALGMHKKGSFYDIVPVVECRIVDEDYRKILRAVMAFAREKDLPFYHRLRHEGYLRHLLVRKAACTGELLIAIVTTTQEERAAELKALCEQLLALPIDGKIAGIVHTSNDSLADVVQSDATEILYGQDYFYEELLGLRFRISEFSFFQTNSLGAEVLYETAREYIGEIRTKSGRKPVIYDLYSGTGTIAQMMAPVAEKVIGVEIVEEAVAAARQNAELNGLHNCEFVAGDVLKVLDEIEEKPDFIILDPPRDGIHPKALQKIIAYGVERLVYISCKPTSLARDLEVFLDRGYRIERMCCVDMFPGTVHVETVCLLSKLNVEHHIEVEINLDEMDLTAAESKATYEEIKAYVKEQTGLQVSNLYIAQVKRKCGIIERVNYNLPKSEDSRQPKCPPEKEEAIKAALKYFKMI